MNVVADAGAVVGWIIVAKNGDGIAGRDGAEQQRDQMRFRVVLFAELPVRIGPRCVEITQPDAAQSVDLVEPVE